MSKRRRVVDLRSNDDGVAGDDGEDIIVVSTDPLEDTDDLLGDVAAKRWFAPRSASGRRRHLVQLICNGKVTAHRRFEVLREFQSECGMADHGPSHLGETVTAPSGLVVTVLDDINDSHLGVLAILLARRAPRAFLVNGPLSANLRATLLSEAVRLDGTVFSVVGWPNGINCGFDLDGCWSRFEAALTSRKSAVVCPLPAAATAPLGVPRRLFAEVYGVLQRDDGKSVGNRVGGGRPDDDGGSGGGAGGSGGGVGGAGGGGGGGGGGSNSNGQTPELFLTPAPRRRKRSLQPDAPGPIQGLGTSPRLRDWAADTYLVCVFSRMLVALGPQSLDRAFATPSAGASFEAHLRITLSNAAFCRRQQRELCIKAWSAAVRRRAGVRLEAYMAALKRQFAGPLVDTGDSLQGIDSQLDLYRNQLPRLRRRTRGRSGGEGTVRLAAFSSVHDGATSNADAEHVPEAVWGVVSSSALCCLLLAYHIAECVGLDEPYASPTVFGWESAHNHHPTRGGALVTDAVARLRNFVWTHAQSTVAPYDHINTVVVAKELGLAPSHTPLTTGREQPRTTKYLRAICGF
eukprot:m.95571 g.95571  ORF g.95571 m.95571 type:complete len:574 (+) comp15157_c3_seq7:118-1839(+)